MTTRLITRGEIIARNLVAGEILTQALTIKTSGMTNEAAIARTSLCRTFSRNFGSNAEAADFAFQYIEQLLEEYT